MRSNLSNKHCIGDENRPASCRLIDFVDALNFARMSQLSAERLTMKLTGQPSTDPLLQINVDEVIGTTPAEVEEQVAPTEPPK